MGEGAQLTDLSETINAEASPQSDEDPAEQVFAPKKKAVKTKADSSSKARSAAEQAFQKKVTARNKAA